LRLARSSIFWKLGLTYFVLLLAVLLALDIYAERILRERYIHAADEQLNSLEQLAKAHPPRFDDKPALASWASWMSHSGVRVTIIASDGRVLADSAQDVESMENHSNRPEFRQAMASGEGKSVRHSHTLNRDLVYWAMRFDQSVGAPVIIRFATPLAQINSALARVRRELWEVSLIILLVAIGILFAFSRRFAGRVERLQEFSREVANGNFNAQLHDSGTDELGDLGRTLNDTGSRLSTMITTINSLSEERNRSAAILRSMVEGVAVIDAREKVTFCNEAFARTWNIQRINDGAEPAIAVIRRPDVLDLIRKALAGQEGSGEISLGSAQPRIFSVTATPILRSVEKGADAKLSEGAETLGAVIVLHEITEIRRLEQVRKDFVANVSHELRTPLTAIQGFAETLLTGGLEDERNNRHFIEVIRSHASRLSRLTDDLLKLSQIEAGKLDMESQVLDIRGLILSTVESVEGAANQKGLSLKSISPQNGLPPVRGNARLLREVLRNLLDNAVQYTPEGGSIEVSVSREGAFAVVSVVDNGIGIPQSDQVRIFERFYRVDAARSRDLGGTGLGLAIAKHIVEAHGGRIWVDSTVAKGSRFHFSVPLGL
jgi:two-component system, OmpR family, phosphate regulon sensor histidine kinase PhoR